MFILSEQSPQYWIRENFAKNASEKKAARPAVAPSAGLDDQVRA
jgi:hypothetical protein